MKTIIKNGEILRVTNEVSDVKVQQGWKFCSKKEWKDKTRVPEVESIVEAKVEEPKKNYQRKKRS